MDFQRLMKEEKDVLLRKWEPFLEGIADEYVVENTAILLENEARYLAEDPGFSATSTGDIQGLQKIMLPIVRRVFPNLIANNIVSVQPIAAPSGIIFYLKYQYGTDKPGNPAGTYTRTPGTSIGVNGQTANDPNNGFPEYSMFEENPGAVEGYNPYYSSDEIGPFSATSANGDTAAATPVASGYFTKWPVSGGADAFFGTIEEYNADGAAVASFNFYSVGGGVFAVKGVDKLGATTDRYTVSVVEGTGVVTVTPHAYVPTANVFKVKAFYKTDLEFTENIPEMRITIGSIPVAVKTRKLKAMWSQESEQDLRAYHGLSADAELTALVSNEMISEIDREIIQKAMSIAPASSRFTHNWSDITYTSGNYLDSHIALMQTVTRASNEVFRKSKIGPANWMVMGTNVASYVENIKGFIPNPVTASMGMSVVKAGNYNGAYDIYKDPMFPSDLILMGHKSQASPFGAGLVYSPYVTNLTPVIVGVDDFNPRRGFLARYGLTQVPHGQLLYSMIKVKGLPN